MAEKIDQGGDVQTDTGKSAGDLSPVTREYYRKLLMQFDASVCEAMAVSQAAAERFELPAVGYSTHVFTRICAHAQLLLRAAPMSRWSRSEYELWDVSAISAYARSILEGYLLFFYLANAPADIDTQRVYINVMHLHDCTKRIKILPHVLPADHIEDFKANAEEIRARLQKIEFFNKLDAGLRKKLLSGDLLMIKSPQEVVSEIGIPQAEYDFYWNYLSQYTHVLSFTFYRIESEGRGTGIENQSDRSALCLVLEFSIRILTAAIDKFVEIFPDTQAVRHGIDSKFSPGPHRNLPRERKRGVRKSR